MVTIRLPEGRPHGVLDRLPAGFSTSRKALEHLRAIVDEHYGGAGCRFICRLVDAAARDEAGLRANIAEHFDRYLEKAAKAARPGGSARVSKLFAITYVAGLLARRWKILPKEWGSLEKVILAVQRLAEDDQADVPPRTALERVQAYVKQNEGDIIDLADADGPYDPTDFQEGVGFLRGKSGRRQVLIPSKRFQDEFPDYRLMMRDLKKAGRAQTEGGKAPKLSIKAPTGLCEGGRVYAIWLD